MHRLVVVDFSFLLILCRFVVTREMKQGARVYNVQFEGDVNEI